MKHGYLVACTACKNYNINCLLETVWLPVEHTKTEKKLLEKNDQAFLQEVIIGYRDTKRQNSLWVGEGEELSGLYEVM